MSKIDVAVGLVGNNILIYSPLLTTTKLFRAGRVTEIEGLGQRFQPKEHNVLVLG
jgi:hypothetical protein